MIFSDSVFFVFFGVFFALYLLTARSLRLQNVLILVASYVFYGWWDPRFLMLIAASTAMDYVAGLAIAGHRTGRAEFLPSALLIGGLMVILAGMGVAELPLVLGFGAGFIVLLAAFTALAGTWSQERRARGFMIASVVFNLGLLGVFKYFNFFADSFRRFRGALRLGSGVRHAQRHPAGGDLVLHLPDHELHDRHLPRRDRAHGGFHPLRGLRELLPAARRGADRAGAPPAAAIRGPARGHVRTTSRPGRCCSSGASTRRW